MKNDSNDIQDESAKQASPLGVAGLIAVSVLAVVCCAVGPVVVLAAITGGIGAWFSGAGLAGTLFVAGMAAAAMYGVSRWRRRAHRPHPLDGTS